MKISRRLFLKRGGIALATVGAYGLWGPSFLHKAVFAAEAAQASGGRKTLVCLFQRGAVDGLSMVAPYGDPFYYQARKEIALAQPSQSAGAAASLDLDGYFGLHPAMEAFLPIYQEGNLAVMHACGSPNNTRSHFDAQDFMESGVASDKSVHSGWLNRLLVQCPEDHAKVAPFRAVAMGAILPRALQGEHEALAIRDLDHFGVAPSGNGSSSSDNSAGAAAGFENMYESAVGDVLHGTGRESFEAISMLKGADPSKYRPTSGADYPKGVFGRSLMQVAQLIKANVGLEIAFVDIDGWDTHANQGAAQGQLANRLREFSRAIAAFYRDLGDRMSDTLILTMSEFGRAVHQNGNRGTDHGHGTCFFVLGGSVRGGKVLGQWPTLAPDKLFENRDLAVTTDYRNIFSEACVRHFGIGKEDLAKVFPDHPIDFNSFPGFYKI